MQPVSLDRVQYARLEFRKTEPAQDAAIKTADPLATDQEVLSLLKNTTDANVFRDQLFELRKISRYDWSLAVPRGVVTAKVGDTITVSYPRFGLNNGKNFIVKRIRRDTSQLFDQLTLYGPQ